MLFIEFGNFNPELLFWVCPMVVSIILIVSGVAYWVSKGKRRTEGTYAIAAVFEFIASLVLAFPECFYSIESKNIFLRILHSFLDSILKVIGISTGNDYDHPAIAGYANFSSGYAAVRLVANLLLLLAVGGYILKFVEGPLSKLKLSAFRKGNVYIFTECNNKTISLAESIASSCEGKKIIVFTCELDESMTALRERVNSIGGLIVDETPDMIVSKTKGRSKGVEVFMFCDKEEDNLIQLDDICESLRGHDGCNVKLYVELSVTPWSLYDGYPKKYGFNQDGKENVIINFIRTEENFVLNTLSKNSIFDNAIPAKSHKDIKVLIVGGMSDRNFEMIRTILHLGQMPGYKLSITVVDNGTGYGMLKQRIPELKEKMDEEGEAIYQVDCFEKVELDSIAFEQKIKEKIPDFTFAFVNAGDDLLNVNLAMRLNAICFRDYRKSDSYMILTNVVNQSICSKWNANILAGIKFVGDAQKTYSYNFITMSSIEKATVAIHYERNKNKSWTSYCNNEYNRHSVYARTLSFMYKVKIIEAEHNSDYSLVSNSKVWKMYEHMRWNMYTRGLGYVYCDPGKLDDKFVETSDAKDAKTKKDIKIKRVLNPYRTIGRVHQDLIAYDDLDLATQELDGLALTENIVSIFHSMDKDGI
ncbi:MAG: hypothetical protein MJ166_07880 [Clostridia bacterium]|nr:hypothetical protein [Clostridia bacterium]